MNRKDREFFENVVFGCFLLLAAVAFIAVFIKLIENI
jgi:hypothetical protein